MWIVEKKCNDLFSRLCIQRRLIIYLGWKCSVYGKSDPIVLPEGREFMLIHLITGIVRFQGYLLRVYGTGTKSDLCFVDKEKRTPKKTLDREWRYWYKFSCLSARQGGSDCEMLLEAWFEPSMLMLHFLRPFVDRVSAHLISSEMGENKRGVLDDHLPQGFVPSNHIVR